LNNKKNLIENLQTFPRRLFAELADYSIDYVSVNFVGLQELLRG